MKIKETLAALVLIAAIHTLGAAQLAGGSPLAPPLSVASPSSQAKQFRLGHLNFPGVIHTREFVIRRMIPLNEGDIFNQSLWEIGLEQINRSGLFEPIMPGDVVMKPDDVTALVDVDLHLKERDHQRIDLSGGGGTTGGTSASLDYSNINLTGRGDRLIARARLGTRERSAGADFSGMLYGRLPISFTVSGFFERLEFVNASVSQQGQEPLFVERTAGGSIGAFLPLTKSRYTIAATTRAGLIYSFTSTNLADALLSATTSPSTLEQGGLRIASLTPVLLHDTLDRQMDPQRGERVTLGFELSGRALGGSLNTFKPYFDYRHFFPIGRKKLERSREPMAIGFRIRASHIRAFGEPVTERALSTVRGVPVFRRFFLGGETEVRGYDINSIAPLARVKRFVIGDADARTLLSSEVRPIGGDTNLILNAEYRVPLVWRFSTAAFIDVGSSFNARSLARESFRTVTTVEPAGTTATILTVLKPLGAEADILPRYRASLGGELRFPIPLVNIPLRLIFAWNPNAQKQVPDGSLLVPEKRFAFRVGFSRTL